MYVKLSANKSVCMHENIVCIPIFLNQTSAPCLFPFSLILHYREMCE